MILQPCKDCTERHTACHDTCEKYREFVAYNSKIKDARRKQGDLESFIYDVEKRREKLHRKKRGLKNG